MKKTKTERGFSVIDFLDAYDNECSIQKSSLATEDAIWFGINEAKPKIMASQAQKFGVRTNETTGWIPYQIPEEVLISTRMHLTQEQVKELLPILLKFVKTGEI